VSSITTFNKGENMAKNKTISQIVKDGLCTGCGTCIALCPEEAIELTKDKNRGIYVPRIMKEKCNNCGICYKVCPGHEIDFKQLNLEIFGKESEDILIGNHVKCYVGHATDYDIRYNSASGGLVTQLLIFALEKRIIDGALVTRMKRDKPLEPEPFIARTREEIIEASKSKYCPVPANIALKEILNSKKGERFAVVGLPCHIHGLRKAEQINKKLKEKIVLHLGISCSSNRNFLATDYLLQKFNLEKKKVTKFEYRGEGWLGKMTVELKSDDSKSCHFEFPYYYYTKLLRSFFFPIRCTLCSDHFCELADISFGDIWLPEFWDDKIGTSLTISRNRIAEDMLQNMKQNIKIELSEVNRNRVIESQKGSLLRKKSYLKTRISLFKLLGKATPIYNQELLKPKFYGILNATFLYLEIYMSSKRFLWGLLEIFSSLLKYGNRLLQGK
jgi:coenzyme F420 hydrogenase subunit beta